MIVRNTLVAGVQIVEIEPAGDERGFFARTFSADAFAEHGLAVNFPECSISFNHKRGTLRGLHLQERPHSEAKLVRCTSGALFDVAVDLRRDSSTFGRWIAVNLSAENRRALYIPEGCAHGFLTLVDHTEVYYQISRRYIPEAFRGLRWDDPELAITWPGPIEVISSRDAALPLLSELFAGSSTAEGAARGQTA
jgi:dTDP-4-dehydrorhamnose 3,5-epimerase